MALLVLLANVLSLVAFGTFIWLVVLAFKRSTGWGLAVLFLSPIAAIIFAIKFWGDAKRPFLLTTGSTVAMFVIVILLAGQLGGFGMLKLMREAQDGEISEEQAAQFIGETMDKWENSGLLDAQEKAELREMRAAFEQEMRGDRAAESGTDLAPQPSSGRSASRIDSPIRVSDAERIASGSVGRKRERKRVGYVAIPVREAESHLGKPVRVVEKSGLRYDGTLAEADGDSLWVERFLVGGSVILELSEREIDTLSVYFR